MKYELKSSDTFPGELFYVPLILILMNSTSTSMHYNHFSKHNYLQCILMAKLYNLRLHNSKKNRYVQYFDM